MTADARTVAAVAGVVRAISDDIDSIQNTRPATAAQLRSTPRATRSKGNAGSTPTESGSDSGSPISNPSDPPSGDSTMHWVTPRNVKGLASQANRVATMVLNGEIDTETARLYSALVRTVAQSASIEVSRARFLATMPDLEFDDAAGVES